LILFFFLNVHMYVYVKYVWICTKCPCVFMYVYNMYKFNYCCKEKKRHLTKTNSLHLLYINIYCSKCFGWILWYKIIYWYIYRYIYLYSLWIWAEKKMKEIWEKYYVFIHLVKERKQRRRKKKRVIEILNIIRNIMVWIGSCIIYKLLYTFPFFLVV